MRFVRSSAVCTAALLLLCGLFAWSCASGGGRAAHDGAPRDHSGGGDERAAMLYARHCAGCHGASGEADTEIAAMLFPRPRPFRAGVFNLASTHNGVPTDEDLVRTMRRGLPGSSMPGYGWLGDEDLLALARFVRGLAVEQLEQDLVEAAIAAAAPGSRVDRVELRRLAADRLAPGAPVVVPEPAPDDEHARELGRAVYLRHCAACHGVEGRGRWPEFDWAGNAELSWARDFTAGWLRAEPSARELTYRIRAGMPASHMPPTALSDAETAVLVRYLQTLIPDGAGEHHVQWRRHLRAVRVPSLPEGPDDAAWQRLEAVRLPLAPLWWRPRAVFDANVRIAHDGERIAFWLEWADDSRDDRAGGAAFQGDGAALQFAAAEDPPFFAMGREEPVDIWFWRSYTAADTAGALDLLGTDDPAVRPDTVPGLPGFGAPSRRGEAVHVLGPRSMAALRGAGTAIEAAPQWRDGRWRLVLQRALRAAGGREIAFAPGTRRSFAIAVWNGSVDPHAASKSVATWHQLALDP